MLKKKIINAYSSWLVFRTIVNTISNRSGRELLSSFESRFNFERLGLSNFVAKCASI